MSGIQSATTLTFYLYHLEIGPTLKVDSTPPRKVVFESGPTLKDTPGLFDRLVAYADPATLTQLKNISTPQGLISHLKACSLMIQPQRLPVDTTFSPHAYNPELALSTLIINAEENKYNPSIFLLSYLYLNGIGVKQNLSYSASLLRFATFVNYPPALYALAYGFSNGVHGFAKDEKLGKEYLYRSTTPDALTAQDILTKNQNNDPQNPSCESFPFPYPQPLEHRDDMELDPQSPAGIAFHEQVLARMDLMEKELKTIKEQNALLLQLVQSLTTQGPQ